MRPPVSEGAASTVASPLQAAPGRRPAAASVASTAAGGSPSAVSSRAPRLGITSSHEDDALPAGCDQCRAATPITLPSRSRTLNCSTRSGADAKASGRAASGGNAAPRSPAASVPCAEMRSAGRRITNASARPPFATTLVCDGSRGGLTQGTYLAAARIPARPSSTPTMNAVLTVVLERESRKYRPGRAPARLNDSQFPAFRAPSGFGEVPAEVFPERQGVAPLERRLLFERGRGERFELGFPLGRDRQRE